MEGLAGKQGEGDHATSGASSVEAVAGGDEGGRHALDLQVARAFLNSLDAIT